MFHFAVSEREVGKGSRDQKSQRRATATSETERLSCLIFYRFYTGGLRFSFFFVPSVAVIGIKLISSDSTHFISISSVLEQ